MLRKHPVLATMVTIALVVSGSVLALDLFGVTHIIKKDSSSKKPAGIHVNYVPATDSEKADSEAQKQAPTDEENTSTDNQQGSVKHYKTVTPELTGWSSTASEVSVNVQVNGVIENSGSCVFTLKMKAKTVSSASHPGEANVSNTTCGRMTIPRSSLTSGTWTAAVTYTSVTAKGTSDTMSIKVQ